MTELGFPRVQALKAIRSSYNVPDISTQCLHNVSNPNESPKYTASQQPHSSELKDQRNASAQSASPSECRLALLSSKPKFLLMRAVIQGSTWILPTILLDIHRFNPRVFQIINANPDSFAKMLNEPLEQGLPLATTNSPSSQGTLEPGYIQVAPEDKLAVDWLKDMGVSEGPYFREDFVAVSAELVVEAIDSVIECCESFEEESLKMTKVTELGFHREDVLLAIWEIYNENSTAMEYLCCVSMPDESPKYISSRPQNPELQDQWNTLTRSAPLSEDPLAFLSSQPKFLWMREMIQAHINLLRTILRNIHQFNPVVLQIIKENQDRFAQMLNEPLEQGAPSATANSPSSQGTLEPGYIQIPPEDEQAVDRAMGVSEGPCIQANFSVISAQMVAEAIASTEEESGESFERKVLNLAEFGFVHGEMLRAMRDAYNHPDSAADYLRNVSMSDDLPEGKVEGFGKL